MEFNVGLGIYIDDRARRFKLIDLRDPARFFKDNDGRLLSTTPSQSWVIHAFAIVPMEYNPPLSIGYYPDGTTYEIFDFNILKQKAIAFAFQTPTGRIQDDDRKIGAWFYRTEPLSQDYVFDLIWSRTEYEAGALLGEFAEKIQLPYKIPAYILEKERKACAEKNNAQDIAHEPIRALCADHIFTILALFFGALFRGETK